MDTCLHTVKSGGGGSDKLWFCPSHTIFGKNIEKSERLEWKSKIIIKSRGWSQNDFFLLVSFESVSPQFSVHLQCLPPPFPRKFIKLTHSTYMSPQKACTTTFLFSPEPFPHFPVQIQCLPPPLCRPFTKFSHTNFLIPSKKLFDTPIFRLFSVPDEGYCRNAPCALDLISTFLS